LSPYIIPLTIVILIILFSIQRHGTTVVGKVFGPVTMLWFLVIAVLGVRKIVEHPEILWAMNPMHAFMFFKINHYNGFIVLGSVFLVVTGGEALYSDLGHFGKTPIRIAWFAVVLPALILNYFGQGAMLLFEPANIKNPFYLMAPEWALLPLVILATFSTVIASQALITGVFSITMQAVQLQYVPRVRIKHTSHEEIGQVYVKSVNLILMVACIILVLAFKSSSNLAAAYGIAVTTTMVITTVLFYFYARHQWNWHPMFAGSLCGFFLLVEASFWGANLLKIIHGGWFPLLVGVIIFTIMTTWHTGRNLVSARMMEKIKPLPLFLEEIREKNIQRVPGTVVFMSGHPDHVPMTLLNIVARYRCMHEHVLLISVKTLDIPHVPKSNRMRFQNVGPQIYRSIIQYGFMDLPNIPLELEGLNLNKGAVFNSKTATYFLGREHILATERKGMAIWREKLFALMSRNSQSAISFFQLPRSRVVEIGSMIEI
jgi:KUP system potassium uptake protein